METVVTAVCKDKLTDAVVRELDVLGCEGSFTAVYSSGKRVNCGCMCIAMNGVEVRNLTGYARWLDRAPVERLFDISKNMHSHIMAGL